MKFNHLIVCAIDVDVAVKFYKSFLGLEPTTDRSFSGDGHTLRFGEAEILIVPMQKDKLPNPLHFALEVATKIEFDRLLTNALTLNLAPRSLPPLDSKSGTGIVRNSGGNYQIFYVLDPSGTNLEVMVRE